MPAIAVFRGRFRPVVFLVGCAYLAGAQLPAQTVPTSAAAPADTARVTVSGLLYLNYQYRLRPAGGANRFDVDRAYLTASGPLGGRVSFRLTTDVYEVPGDTLDRSWQIRAKYAFLQYDYSRSAAWPAWTRLGMLHTVFIDHDETFWPRWIQRSPTDQAGFFSSADVGAATRIGLPQRSGEIYATITNGPGFASREIDRFKDYSARLTFTPLAMRSGSAWRTFALTFWGYKGALASRFAAGGPGQISPIHGSLRRDRWGVFTAVSHPRATLSVQYARRVDEGDHGANTPDEPRTVADSTGYLTAAYLVARPLAAEPRLLLIGRWDRVDRNVAVGRRHDFVIGGAGWAISPRASVALTFQGTYPGASSAIGENRTVLLQTFTGF
jgi:hypothetical protein